MRVIRAMLTAALVGTILVGGSAVATAAPADQTTRLVEFDGTPGPVIPGTKATLVRGDDKVDLEVKTRGLGDEYAYTVWWIVFNDPVACGEVCNGADFGNPDVGASALWATGAVSKHNGTARFAATLVEDVAPGQVLFGPGLTDAAAAEIHVIVRSHGPASADAATLEAQLTTLDGGCGTFACHDPQAGAFV